LRQRDVTVEHFNGFDIDDLGEAVIEIWPEDQRAGFDKANNYGLTQEKLKTLKQRSEWERYSYVDVEGVTCVVAEVSPRNDRCFLGADIWLQQVIPLLGAFIFVNLGSKQGPMLSRVLRSKLGVPLYSE
jgi:hypothetical protein